MITDVFEIESGEVIACYTLPPRQALVACYEQEVRKNFNTWTYDEKQVPIKQTKYGYTAGPFWVKQ